MGYAGQTPDKPVFLNLNLCSPPPPLLPPSSHLTHPWPPVRDPLRYLHTPRPLHLYLRSSTYPTLTPPYPPTSGKALLPPLIFKMEATIPAVALTRQCAHNTAQTHEEGKNRLLLRCKLAFQTPATYVPHAQVVTVALVFNNKAGSVNIPRPYKHIQHKHKFIHKLPTQLQKSKYIINTI